MKMRRSMRLGNYDYRRSGVYFVTLCTYRFAHVFGQIVDGNVELNDLGRLVEEEWTRTALIRPSVDTDLFVVMPNHLHGLLFLRETTPSDGVSSGAATLRANSLGSIIGQFKSIVTKRSRSLAVPPGGPIWKRNYYDHIVRNQPSLDRIRRYIIANPARWQEDEYFSE